MRWASAIAIVIFAMVSPGDDADAGDTHAVPPVRVVAPNAQGGIKLERDDLPVPQPEVIKHPVKVDAPAIPSFDLPATDPGFRGARELRIHGRRTLGSEVKVKGYVTWLYDCGSELARANPDATPAQVGAAIRNDPTLCERPMFALGDARDTPRDTSILVVDAAATPKLGSGDYVVVTGTWTVRTPQGDPRDGVLRYKLAEKVPPPPATAAGDPATGLKELEIDLDATAPPALRRFVDDVTLNTSIDHFNACNKAITARQYDAAITECQTATQIWQDNHLAWYAWASAHMARREWAQAKAVVENAVTLRPDQAMYQLYYGISLYETERQQAREDEARKAHKKPEEVELDPAVLKLDAARDALTSAIKLAPDLWRAHYYLGRVYRDLDDHKHAAQQFTATIRTHPGYRFGYIALSELYRRWDYLDQALAVAMLGTANVAGAEAGDLWFEVGAAHEAKHADDKAIEAFGKAIAGKPSDALARLQRAQLYLRKGDLAGAKRDLDDVTRSSDPRAAPAKLVAAQLLKQIASSKGTPSSRGPSWDCRRAGNALICRPLFTPGSVPSPAGLPE